MLRAEEMMSVDERKEGDEVFGKGKVWMTIVVGGGGNLPNALWMEATYSSKAKTPKKQGRW